MHAQGTAVPSGQGTARFGTARTDRIAYTVAEVAALLGKHSNTVYGWVRSARCRPSGSATPSTSPSGRSLAYRPHPPRGMRPRDRPSKQALPAVWPGPAGR